jgi:hypothetical protein
MQVRQKSLCTKKLRGMKAFRYEGCGQTSRLPTLPANMSASPAIMSAFTRPPWVGGLVPLALQRGHATADV